MITELSGDQIRIQTNAAQVFESWREAEQEFAHSYKGRMNWSRVHDKQYLYRIVGNSRRSLGVRSAETEQIKEDYTKQRTKLKRRVTSLRNKLKELAPINRAYRIARVPKIAAEILRALDKEGLLGDQLIVVGTHSLYAYEAAAGVHFNDALLATEDIDLLWDVRKKIKLALMDVHPKGVMSILKNVDSTFSKSRQAFRASNDDGYLVDLIRPMETDEMSSPHSGIGDASDLEASAIMGLQWLINAPRFNQIAIAEDGYPVYISCIDPRAFALFKRWMAVDAQGREAAKKRRDIKQAEASAVIAQKYLDLKFNAKDLTALPIRLVQHAMELVKK